MTNYNSFKDKCWNLVDTSNALFCNAYQKAKPPCHTLHDRTGNVFLSAALASMDTTAILTRKLRTVYIQEKISTAVSYGATFWLKHTVMMAIRDVMVTHMTNMICKTMNIQKTACIRSLTP